MVFVFLKLFFWLLWLPQYGQLGGLPLGILITSRYLWEALIYKSIDF